MPSPQSPLPCCPETMATKLFSSSTVFAVCHERDAEDNKHVKNTKFPESSKVISGIHGPWSAFLSPCMLFFHLFCRVGGDAIFLPDVSSFVNI